MLKIIEFLKNYPNNWERLLKEDPYNLRISKDQDYAILSYDQIKSDFSQEIVQQCRGIIIDINSLTIKCLPFFKFWNYKDYYAADIHWPTARVQEKLDGSIIKLWWDRDHWWVSTNGVIDAQKCDLFNDLNDLNRTYYDLFNEAAVECLDYARLSKGCTYIFELVSPFNRVVVPYKETKIYHIGTRDNRSFEELDVDIGVPKPKSYRFNSLAEVMDCAKKLPFSEEGYVVVDGYWNRVKIKSPAYVSVHHLSNNGRVNKKRIIELIMINEHEEFLTYFPEYKEHVDNVLYDINNFFKKIEEDIEKFMSKEYIDRKAFALDVVANSVHQGILFSIKDGKVTKDNYKDYFRNLFAPYEKMMGFLGYQD